MGDLTSQYVGRAVSGDDEALAWVVRRFSAPLLLKARALLRRTRDRAREPEDLVAETWLVAIPRLGDFGSQDGHLTPVVLAYLVKCLNHLCANCNRLGERRGQPVSLDPTTGGTPGPSARAPARDRPVFRAMEHEAVRKLIGILERLSASERSLLDLAFLDDLKNAKIAELLNDTPANIAVRKSRLRKKILAEFPDCYLEDYDATGI